MNLYESSFRRFAARIEDRGHRLSHSTLGGGVWTIVINPRPFWVFRVQFDAASRQLTLRRRKPFFYRELLRRTLDDDSLDAAIRDVLAMLGPAPPGRAPGAPSPPGPVTTEDAWPALKQFEDLTEDDFAQYPVWINCHVEDYEQPWYGQTNEATFRPWAGALPISPSQGMFAVRSTAHFRDGSIYPAVLTPAFEESDLGAMQPYVFIGKKQWGFWGGRPGISVGWRQRFYEASKKEPEEIFPIRVSAEAGLADGVTTCQVDGFYWLKGKAVVLER